MEGNTLNISSCSHPDLFPPSLMEGVFPEGFEECIVASSGNIIPRISPLGFWILEPLFKLSRKNVMEWWIGFFPERRSVFTVWGFSGGRMQVSCRIIPEEKTEENILKEMTTVFSSKVKEGYHPTGTPQEYLPEAMLATVFEKASPRTKKEFPFIGQPKLDGVRLLCTMELRTLRFFTRAGTDITARVSPVFGDACASILSSLGERYVLDGEVYVHDPEKNIRQQDIRGAINTSVRESVLLRDRLIFNIFTTFHPEKAEDSLTRLKKLEKAFQEISGKMQDPQRVVLVHSVVITDEEKRLTFMDECISEGYEGVMLYKTLEGSQSIDKCSYKKSRTENIMKMKLTESEEGVVVGFRDAKSGDDKMRPLLVRLSSGAVIGMMPKVSHEVRRQWVKNPELVIGKTVTFEFRGRSTEGTPLTAVVVAIREGD